jgi:hypothetical protein
VRNRTYLGDSVYVSIENGMIRLCTNNGLADENVIFLEDAVYHNLEKWVDRLKRQEDAP